MNNTIRVLKFWLDVESEFPSEQLYTWMNAVSEDKADWFRNYSLTRVAIASNSENNRGMFSQRKYEANMAKLKEIESRHQDVVRLMQW